MISALLTFITLRAHQSWSRDHEREARWDFGLVFCEADDDDDVDEVTDPLLGFDSDEERDAYVTRQRLIERRGIADGMTALRSKLSRSDCWIDRPGLTST